MSTVCEVSYDSSVPYVVMPWNGYATSEQFREGNADVLAMLRETRAGKLLGDVRDLTLIHTEEQEWLNDTWIPRAVNAGLRAVALVTPSFCFNRVAVQTVSDRVDPNALQIRSFSNRDQALDWLRTV